MEKTVRLKLHFDFLFKTAGSFFLICLFFVFSSPLFAQNSEAFKLHLNQAPLSFNPQLQKSSTAQYLMGNIHRNLLRFNAQNQLENDLAESCRIEKSVITCVLKKGIRWSDGSALTANDFIKSYQLFLDPKTGVTRLDLVDDLHGALEYYSGKSKFFGVSEKDSRTLVFHVKTSPENFIFHLASTLLSPIDPQFKKFSGPFIPEQPINNQKIVLKSNPHYWVKNPKRPSVEFLIVEEDSVALNLYNKNQLTFLRRLPTALIPRYKKSAEFHWVSLLRSDYIGFLENDWKNQQQRQEMIQGLNYPELQSLFHSEGTPGCLGLPASWFENNRIPCYQFKAPSHKTKQLLNLNKTLSYSTAGGDDHRRAMEWVQDQWKKNLGLLIQVRPLENKLMSSELRAKKLSLFRRGVPVEVPHCGEALKYFSSTHPENFIGFKNEKFDHLIENFLKLPSLTQKKNCTTAAQLLMDSYLLIPLGQIHFAILAKTQFKGWTVNSLNQLDLTNLTIENN